MDKQCWLLVCARDAGCWCGHAMLAAGVCTRCWLLVCARDAGCWCGHAMLAAGVGTRCWLLVWARVASCWCGDVERECPQIRARNASRMDII
eukprot:355181-Chlamydomonas_euryale.AAC.6